MGWDGMLKVCQNDQALVGHPSPLRCPWQQAEVELRQELVLKHTFLMLKRDVGKK